MRPLISPLNLQQRLLKRVALATLATLLLFLLLLPTLLTQAIRYQVPRLGLGSVEIGNIDLNLFRGKVLLEEVALYKSAARVFSLERAELDLSTLSLFEQRLHIQSLSIDGFSMTIRQNPGEPLQVAGVSIPGPPPATTPPVTEDSPTPWAFGIDAFNLQNSSLQIVHPQFSETVTLDAISLGALAMWRPDYITPLTLNISLREGSLTLEAKGSPFSQAALHQATLNIASLPLESFAELAKPTLTGLSGALSTQFNFQLQQHIDGKLSVNQKGKLSLADLALQSGTSLINQKSMLWDGTVDLSDVAQLDTLRVGGDLTLSGTSLKTKGKKDDGIALQRLSLTKLQLLGTRELALTEVAVDGLKAEAVRSDSGVKILGLATPKAPIEEDTIPAKAEVADSTESPPEPFHFRVERVLMSGTNRFTLDDKTVKPPFRHSFILTSADIQGLNSRKPEEPTNIEIKGKDDFYTEFTVKGTAKPLAAIQPSIDLKVKLDSFDMPPTSPYLVQLMGYRIATGQLHTDSVMAIEKNVMKGEVKLTLSQAKFEPEDPARMENLQAKTSIPLNTALSLLRDRDDNIKLKLPIEGRLDDPEFDISNIINTALGNALKGASVSYLKLMLQPYGSLISVIQLAGDAAGRIQLDPMLFEPGSSTPNSNVVAYIEKISQLLIQKGVNMKICGFATTADLLVQSKGKVTAIPPAGHPPLEALAKQRAESIKLLLVKQYGVAAKQLFVCHPELDRSAEAKERVELSI